MVSVGIVGTGSYVPERVLTNFDLEKMVDTSDEWIVTRTGIRERRICDPETAVSDLCYHAAAKALADAGIEAEDVDLVIVATVTPDYAFPATAGIVAHRLGAKNAAAFDLAAGCAGFIYGVATGSQFVASGLYRTVLVIGGETLSKIVDWQDRATCVLFGDGAGAVVLQPVEEGYGFLGFELGADGSGAELLIVPEGGSRCPLTPESLLSKRNTIHMAGREVFKFAVRVMDEATVKVLEKVGLDKGDVDVFIPHQANIRIVDAALKRLGIDPGRVVVNLDRYGNMSAASIPVALDEALKGERIKDGDIVLFVGFGAGLAWGAAVMKWGTGKR